MKNILRDEPTREAPRHCIVCRKNETGLEYRLVVPTSCDHALCERCAVERVWTMRKAGTTNCSVCNERMRELRSVKLGNSINGLNRQEQGGVRVRFCSIVWTLYIATGEHVEDRLCSVFNVPRDRIGLLHKGKRIPRSEWDNMAQATNNSNTQSISPTDSDQHVHRPLLMLVGTPAPPALPLGERVISSVQTLVHDSWSICANFQLLVTGICSHGVHVVLLFLSSMNPWGEHAIVAPPNRNNEQRARRNAEFNFIQETERMNGDDGQGYQWDE